jgi:hypothetical protein
VRSLGRNRGKGHVHWNEPPLRSYLVSFAPPPE